MKPVLKFAGTLVILLIGILGLGLAFWDDIAPRFFEPTTTNLTTGVKKTEIEGTEKYIQIIARKLRIPWEIVFLPSGDMLVTERPGTLVHINDETQTVTQVEGVKHRGEGGLLGMALHPDFEENQQIYLYMTTKVEDGLRNRVMRYTYADKSLTNPKPIIEGIPGAPFHDGGRIAFGPEGYLYITVGDALNQQAAQDTGSLAGSILRLNPDGSIPNDNPFDNAIYSYGHRNPQGLAWDTQGRLWATEHGNDSRDEVNLIQKGKNYGWPTIRGDQTQNGMQTPVRHSGVEETWAPGGATFVEGDLFFVGLREQSVYQASVDGDSISDITAHFRTDYGRLRTVVQGPDGMLYVTTSNRDGRGQPVDSDDRIIRINPEVFEIKR